MLRFDDSMISLHIICHIPRNCLGFYLGAVSALRKQRCHHSAHACPMESPQMIQISAALMGAETGLLKGRLGQPLDRSQSQGAQDDTDELDRTLEDRYERRWVDERRTSNAENEVEGELVHGHGENRLEASTNEEDGWTLAEEHEDIQDDVAFVDGDWNENAAVSEQKDCWTPCWPWTPTSLCQMTRW